LHFICNCSVCHTVCLLILFNFGKVLGFQKSHSTLLVVWPLSFTQSMLNLLENSSSDQITTGFDSPRDMSYLYSHFNRSLKLLVSHPMRTVIILQSAQVNGSLQSQGSNRKAELQFPFCISPKTGGLALLWVSLSAQALSHLMSKKWGPSEAVFGCHNTVPGWQLCQGPPAIFIAVSRSFHLAAEESAKETFGISNKSGAKWLLRITACRSVSEVDCRWPMSEEITKISIYIPLFLEACWFELEKEKYIQIV